MLITHHNGRLQSIPTPLKDLHYLSPDTCVWSHPEHLHSTQTSSDLPCCLPPFRHQCLGIEAHLSQPSASWPRNGDTPCAALHISSSHEVLCVAAGRLSFSGLRTTWNEWSLSLRRGCGCRPSRWGTDCWRIKKAVSAWWAVIPKAKIGICATENKGGTEG
jgi:hypothetical protein